MELSQNNAMKIVTEISEVIHQHVNLMDENGFIIASTDFTRIGAFHEGAAVLIRQRLDKLIIENDMQFKGSRKGINLPLILNGDIVGVIGVTGEYSEVMKYGQIIKKMTETLLLENYNQQQKKLDDRIRIRFLDEWILDGAPLTSEMIERGERLNIDVLLPYRVMVAVIADFRRYSDTSEGQKMIDNINREVRGIMEDSPGGIFTKTASKMICLMPGTLLSDNVLGQRAEYIIDSVQKEFHVSLYAGIDGGAQNLHQAYIQASKAVQSCSECSRVGFYDRISLEIFMDEISQNSKSAFVRRIFKDCTEKEIANWAVMLPVYFETNGSLNRTAQKLFIHKNTLQYKLNKLSEKTGYDPRKLSDCALLYLALQFYHTLGQS